MNTRVIKLKRDNKEICLVGAQHIATSEYFNKIQTILDSFEPIDVFYEMMEYESKSGNSENKELDLLYKNLMKITGLLYQTDCIKYNEKWNKSDISLELFESFLGGKMDDKMNTSDKIKQFNIQVEKCNPKFLKLMMMFVIKHLNIITKFNKDDKTTLDVRNNKVLLDIFEHLCTSDNVCVFYGEQHLGKIKKYLESIGFNVVKNEKLNPLK